MFDPREFHAFAEQCSIDPANEAACRSAISRAYYAAYLVTYDHIRKKRIRVDPPLGEYWGPHERTIHAVESVRHPGAAVIMDDLLKLKRLRVSADYDMRYTGAGRQVAEAIRDATRIITWIDALP